MSTFGRYVGIDYSGRGKPAYAYREIQVYVATEGNTPTKQRRPDKNANWSRESLAEWLLKILAEPAPTIVGIDHAFSLPIEFLESHDIGNWDEFLIEFCKHWPTDKQEVKDLREGNQFLGKPSMTRLTDNRAPNAKNVFRFGFHGEVATSTHAGIPWLKYLRGRLGSRVHLWPFDGFDSPVGKSVVAEVYPRLFRRWYGDPPKGGNTDKYDAWMVCNWLRDNDRKGRLSEHFDLSLSRSERAIVQIEGWMLGLK